MRYDNSYMFPNDNFKILLIDQCCCAVGLRTHPFPWQLWIWSPRTNWNHQKGEWTIKRLQYDCLRSISVFFVYSFVVNFCVWLFSSLVMQHDLIDNAFQIKGDIPGSCVSGRPRSVVSIHHNAQNVLQIRTFRYVYFYVHYFCYIFSLSTYHKIIGSELSYELTPMSVWSVRLVCQFPN